MLARVSASEKGDRFRRKVLSLALVVVVVVVVIALAKAMAKIHRQITGNTLEVRICVYVCCKGRLGPMPMPVQF